MHGNQRTDFQESVLALDVIKIVSLVSAAAYSRLAGLQVSRKVSCMCLLSHHGNAGFTDVCQLILLFNVS